MEKPTYIPTPEEKHLLQLLQSASSREYNQGLSLVLDRYQSLIHAMVHQHGGSPEDAEDVLQEGTIGLYRLVNRQPFALSCKVSTLLYAICRRQWLKVLRKRNNEPKGPPGGDFPDPPVPPHVIRQIEVNDMIGEIRSLIARLPERDQRIIEMTYMKEIDATTIAEEMGLSSGQVVRNIRRKCLNVFREVLQNYPELEHYFD
jgi:RNA polymerase sigma factor (sigma-70 family)